MIRIGSGFDVHRLVKGDGLTLGGIRIDCPMSLQGYSDADVLLHALMDALLGAAGLPDIGCHFPPGDDRFHNISSLILLDRVRLMLEEEQWCLVNADLTVIAEKPKIAPYRDEICSNIASALKTSRSRISLKATTTEGLGFCGRGEGIAAQAFVLIEKAPHADTVSCEAG